MDTQGLIRRCTARETNGPGSADQVFDVIRGDDGEEFAEVVKSHVVRLRWRAPGCRVPFCYKGGFVSHLWQFVDERFELRQLTLDLISVLRFYCGRHMLETLALRL